MAEWLYAPWTVLLTIMMLVITSQTCPVRECSCTMSSRGVNIDCSNKNFDKVPEFDTTTDKFYQIDLSGNHIGVIPGKAFKKISVEIIDLSGNSIRKISPNAFEGLETTLKELTLEARSDTPIKFPTDLLHSLTALEAVKIKGFDMPVLEHGIFIQSKNLQRLTLEDCKIITIFSTAFQGLDEKLTDLDLSNNRLTSIPVTELKPLVNLQKLVLAQNRITNVPHGSFINLTKLIDLDLSMNSIQSIESSAFSGLISLEYLGLHANMISQTSLLAVASLSNLEQLNLAYNLFMDTLPDYTFKNLNKLAYLNLQGNSLNSISPATFEGLGTSLSVLILSENKLTNLPDEGFRHLKNLRWLYLDLMNLGGSLTQHTFHGLETTLEYLTLESVKFVDQDWPSVHYLTALKSLNLCQNDVTNIPAGTFRTMNNLKNLILCHNNVSNVNQETFRGLEQSLQELNMESNTVKTIDRCTLRGFSKLRSLNLDGNPLNCDCRLTWLREWIDNQDDITKMLIGWTCSEPANHNERLLKHVSVNELICETKDNVTCTDFIEPTSAPVVPHAHIQSAEVGGDSISIKWTLDNPEPVVGVRLFYKMTDNETYSYTLLLNPSLREYIIHDLYTETNYTICIGLDLKLGRHLPDEECITVSTDRSVVDRTQVVEEKYQKLHIIVGASVGAGIFVILLIVIIVQTVRWRRKTRCAKDGYYGQPWVTARPQAPSLSTLPSRRSDFENPITTHYYSRPLSTGTIRTISSHLPRSHSMATVLDSDYDRSKQNLDQINSHYDMNHCLSKIDNLMASASNLLVHQPNRFDTPIVSPPAYKEDITRYPEEVSAYPHQFSRISTRPHPCDATPSYGREPHGPISTFGQNFDYSPQGLDLDHSHHSHLSDFPGHTKGFDELEEPPAMHNLHRQSSEQTGAPLFHDNSGSRVPSTREDGDLSRSTLDPLPPPPAYMLDSHQEMPYNDDRHIYDEIYTLY